jgi:hypothetical protein
VAIWLSTPLIAFAAETAIKIEDTNDAIRAVSKYFDVRLSRSQPQFLALSADNLGQGRFAASALEAPPASPRPTAALHAGNVVAYRTRGQEAASPARWTFEFGDKSIRMVSEWSEKDVPEPVVLQFNAHKCHATLLGLTNPDGSINLPAVLHLPSQGTFRITAPQSAGAKLGYDARRAVGPFVQIVFPPATKEMPRVEYRWEATAIYPQLAGIENDARFDGFRRCWLNILQVNPRLGVLGNNAASDTCASCVMEYADIAMHTPKITDSTTALDLIRQLLDWYIAGNPGYGFPGWVAFDTNWAPSKNPIFLDAYPNLLNGAADYVHGSGDTAWLKNNYPALRGWTDALLATDRNANGLFEYELSGNSGSWGPGVPFRPSNWWDTVGFGHEDAYANALAYRALRGMENLATSIEQTDDAARFRKAADRVREVYVKTFFNPATGVLAGWKSADGELHDYYFLFVSGIAIHYGLVPKDQANAIMDKLLAKMKEVGYTRFDLGLPGNLVPIARKDYVHLDPRWGGGQKDDGSDAFQIYENGGATACFAYYTLAALYDLGRRDEADRILFPMLDSFAKGGFEGTAPNGMTYDWKTWDGTPWGYEGFLTDNYYALLAVVAREKSLKNTVPPFGAKSNERP